MSSECPSVEAFKGREIIVAVCGGIAAYKVADVVSKLVQRGAGVTVVMTPDAQKFVTPLTFQAISGRPVRTDPYDLTDSSDGDEQPHVGQPHRAGEFGQAVREWLSFHRPGFGLAGLPECGAGEVGGPFANRR